MSQFNRRAISSLCMCYFGMFFTEAIDARTTPPNIIVIMADDQGWGDLSFNGNKTVRTPHIDRIANEGASFRNFYVCPVSSPTRAEFLTGRYAMRGGVVDVSGGGERLNLNERTVADYLKEAGYVTAAFGKWHNGTQYPYHPNARGFDEFYGFCSGHWGNYWNPMLEHNGEIIRGDGFIIDDLTNKALDYIMSNKEKPFFLFLPYNTPHSPMQVTDRWWNGMKDRELEQSATVQEKEDATFTRAALALTENLDWNVGRVLSAVEKAGLDEQTIIIYLSDNGPNSHRWNGGMQGTKGSTDEGGVRSPLFIRWPKNISSGLCVQQLSGGIDLLPTLLEAAGVTPAYKNKLDGMSLFPVLVNPNKIIERSLVSYWNKKLSIRIPSYLLTADGALFNTNVDRAQTTDVSARQSEIKSRMTLLLKNYQQEVLSKLPEKDTRVFTIGHPAERFSKLPARDGAGHGQIERSNKYPNSSYFMNWTQTSDSITWNVEVEQDGLFEVLVYYTCTKESVGSELQLSIGNRRLVSCLSQENDVPMLGADLDRIPRVESYSKGFAPFSLGTISLDKGKQAVSFKANKIQGNEVMNFQMLVFRRMEK